MKFSLLHLAMLASPLIGALARAAWAQDREHAHDWEHARDVVDRVLRNLHHIERNATIVGEDRDRYDRAARSLAEVQASLADGRFDQAKLEAAIDSLDRLTRSRGLDPRDQDLVLQDLKDLRRLREEWRDGGS
jgi:hypothetical protein